MTRDYQFLLIKKKVHTSKIRNCLRPHILSEGRLSKGLIFIWKTPIHSSMPFSAYKGIGLVCEVLPGQSSSLPFLLLLNPAHKFLRTLYHLCRHILLLPPNTLFPICFERGNASSPSCISHLWNMKTERVLHKEPSEGNDSWSREREWWGWEETGKASPNKPLQLFLASTNCCHVDVGEKATFISLIKSQK